MSGDVIYLSTTHSKAMVTQLNSGVEAIGTWDPGTYVYSFTYEYGEGKTFYQSGPFTNPH